MRRYAFGLVAGLALVAGCDTNGNGTPKPPAKTTTHDTKIQTPNGDVNIHRQKTETPDGSTKRHIEIERKDKP